MSVTNPFGTDNLTQTGYITVLPGIGAALPISEGFEGGVAPTNWSINNGGNAVTWVQDTPGNAPTATNSASIDNFNTNTTGQIDDLVVEPVDLTGYSSATLTFDVAYAQYDNTYNDQLDVLVSNDCGQSFNTVYSKAGATLATDPNQTGAYTANTWRTETIDLTPYVGSGKVDVLFRNISGWGQFLFIDNVNITGVVSSPTADFTAAPDPACVGQTVTFTDASTNATSWDWNFGAGATPATATGAGPHDVVYSTSGTKNVSLDVNSGASISNQTVTINPLPTPTITASGATTFCAGGSVTLTSSSATGNVWSTGETTQSIVVSTSGSYTVSVTDANGCTGTSVATVVTVNPAPTAPVVTASGSTTFCAGGSVDLTSDQATGNLWSTGETTQTITVSASGSYSVTYTDGNGCSATSAATTVTVNPTPVIATGTITDPSTCGGTDGSIVITGSGTGQVGWAGTASGTSGVVTLPYTITGLAQGPYTIGFVDANSCVSNTLNVTLNDPASAATPVIIASGATTFCAGGSVTLTSDQATGNVWSTGETTQSITVSTSGSYTVTYTNGSGCSATSATTTVTVNPLTATPTITASGATIFCAGGSVDLTSSAATGNVWSTGETTQTITVSASGSYSVTYTDGNGCSATSAVTTVTVNPAPTTPVITASGSTTFCAGGSIDLTSDQATGNVWSTGETTQTITVSTSGSYSVTYTDGNGCSATSATTTVTVNPTPTAPVVTASGSTTFCAGGSVDLTSDQATGNLWSTGETTQTITVSASGSYSVTYTDGNGCSATSAATTVTVNPTPTAPVVTASGSTTFCAGGSVDLTSDQATGNLWSTGETTQTITVSASGSYSVTYTDGNGCSVTSAATTVTVNPTPVISTGTVTDPSTCGATDGSIVINGSATGTVTWTGSASGTSGVVTLPYTISGLAGGSYSVDFVSTDGCSSNTVSATLVNSGSATTPVVTASGATTFCDGGSVTLTSDQATGNVWSTGETTQTITVSASGSYSVTYTDGNGCTATSAVTTVTVNPAPTAPVVTASGSTTFCDGGSIDLTSDQATGNVWSTGETTQTITVSASGSYSVTYTDGNGCSATSAVTTVTVNPAPTAPVVTASGSTTFCDGGSIDLTSDQATGNVWSTGETTQTITVSASGSYSVTYTDGNGCTATSAATTVTVNPWPTAPVVTASGSTTFCDGGSIDLTSDQVTGNLWSTGETTQTITVSTSGTYSVTYIDGNGCSATSATTTVTVNSTPVISTGTVTDPSTCGATDGSIVINGSATGTVTWTGSASGTSGVVTLPYTISGLTGGSYSVDFVSTDGCSSNTVSATLVNSGSATTPVVTASGATTFCAGGSVTLTSDQATGNVWSSGETTQSITVSTSGSYTVTYTNGSGCSATSAATTVTVNPLPATPAITASGATTFCAGGSVDLTSSATAGNGWSTLETTQTITVSTSGTYSVTVTDGNGCQATSAPITVTVNPAPTAPVVTASGSTTFCAGGSVDLTSSQATGNVWSNGSFAQTINVTNSGNYSVTYTDANGCQATSAPITVTVNPLPTAPVVTASGATTFCQGGSVDLSSDQTIGNVWSTGATTQSINVTSTGTYFVVYTDANGCSATSTPVSVVVNALPNVNAGPDQAICDGESVILTGSGAQAFTWNNGVTNGVSFVPTATATYTVTGTDANGCSNTDQVDVVVNPLPTVTLTSPIDTTCNNADPITLSASPAGGTYSGATVVGDVFDPVAAGAGTYDITYSFTDANGCDGSATVTIVVDNCLSIDENAFATLEVYPNPMSDELLINLDGNFTYELVDARGRLIFKGDGVNEAKVNTSEYEMGVYFVNIFTNENATTVRVLKQ